MDEFSFTDSVIKGSVGYGGWCTHGGAFQLMPVGIAEAKYVFSHDEAKGHHDCFIRDGREALAITLEVVSDDAESTGGVDVSVHRDGVGGE